MKRRFSRGWGQASKSDDQSRLLSEPALETAGFDDFDDEEFEIGSHGEEPAGDDGSGQVVVTVSKEDSGKRLDVVLAARKPEFSRSQLARLAKDGLALLDGQAAKAGTTVTEGQVISLPRPRAPLTDIEPDPSMVLDVIYEDEHILVINKPWNLVVHPAPGHSGATLASGLLARDMHLKGVGEKFRPGLVHRLDKDTSGVIITARTEQALRELADSFSRRETKKNYLAFVKGRLPNKRGVIDSPLGRHQSQRHKMAAGVTGGRPARTLYRVLRFFPTANISLVLLTLVTGRTHQARVHLQSLGTPILADPVYSRGIADLVKSFPELQPHLQRQMLHARRLTIAHPVSGEPVTFRAPWPQDFNGLLKAILSIENK